MAAKNFQPLASRVIGIEGGVSDRPLKADPGGLTNKGVTQKTYDNWRELRGLPKRSVREITTQEVVALAKANYWNTVQGDKLPSGVDFAVFDFSFNSGPAQAVKELQRTLGVAADGVVGVATLRALSAVDPRDVINGVCDRRLAFMKRLRNWKANKNGWTNRVAHVRQHSLAMIDEAVAPEPVAFTAMPTAKAIPAPPPLKKSATVWSLIVGGVATVVTTAKDILLQVPEFANTAMSGIGVFVDKSPLAQTIANGIGALGALGVLYATYSVIKSKREAHADHK